ncbi:MAG: glycosyltransferase, partial [Candidatus Binatia bacterium]
MKVLMLVHGLGVGGTEFVVFHLARFLRRSGVDVDVGCLDVVGALGDELRRQGFRVACYQRKPGLDLSLPWRIAADVRRNSVDVVHAHQVTSYAYGVLAKVFTRKPLVFTEHGRFHPDSSTRRRRLFNRIFSRLVDRTTAVSGSVRE